MRGTAPESVDQYLDAAPEPARSTLLKLRAEIRALVPEAEELIWYGMPTFKVGKPLVCYAYFKNHCSLFPCSGKILDEIAEDLKDYRTSKGTIQFPHDSGLPLGLVKSIVTKRIEEVNSGKKMR